MYTMITHSLKPLCELFVRRRIVYCRNEDRDRWNSNRVATVSRHEGIGLAAMSQEGFRAAFQRA